MKRLAPLFLVLMGKALASPIDEVVNFYRAVYEIVQNPSAFNNYFPQTAQLIPYIAIFFRKAHIPTILSTLASVLLVIALVVLLYRAFAGSETFRSAIIRVFLGLTIFALFRYTDDGAASLPTTYTPNPGAVVSIDPDLVERMKSIYLNFSIVNAEYFKAKAIGEMAAGAKPFYELLIYSTLAKWAAGGIEGTARQLAELGGSLNPITGVVVGTASGLFAGVLGDVKESINGFARIIRLFYFGTPLLLLTIYTTTVFIATAVLYLLFYSLPLLAPLVVATPGGLAAAGRVARYLLVLFLVPIIAGISIWFSSWLIYNYTRGAATAAKDYMEAQRVLLPIAQFNRYVEPQWEVLKTQLENLSACAESARQARSRFRSNPQENRLVPLAELATENKSAYCFGAQSLLLRSVSLGGARLISTPDNILAMRPGTYLLSGEKNDFIVASSPTLETLKALASKPESYSMGLGMLYENLLRSTPEYAALNTSFPVRLVPDPGNASELRYMKDLTGARGLTNPTDPLAGCLITPKGGLGIYCLTDDQLDTISRTFADARGKTNEEIAQLIMKFGIADVSGDLRIATVASLLTGEITPDGFEQAMTNLNQIYESARLALSNAGFNITSPSISDTPPEPSVQRIWGSIAKDPLFAAGKSYIEAIRNNTWPKSGQLWPLSPSGPDFVTVYAAFYPIVQKALNASFNAAASSVGSFYFYIIVAGLLALILILGLLIALIRTINFVLDAGGGMVTGAATMGTVGAAGAGVLAGGSGGSSAIVVRNRPGPSTSGGSTPSSSPGGGPTVSYVSPYSPSTPPGSAASYGVRTSRPALYEESGKSASDLLK